MTTAFKNVFRAVDRNHSGAKFHVTIFLFASTDKTFIVFSALVSYPSFLLILVAINTTNVMVYQLAQTATLVFL